MFGRRGKRQVALLLLILSSLTPQYARAKTYNFTTGSAFGMGFRIGAEKNPATDFVTQPQANASEFSPTYSLSPFFDFENFTIRFHGTLHKHPVASGKGSDTVGTYQETSDARTLSYGTTLQLSPFISEDNRQRLYFFGSFGKGSTKIKSTRHYSSSTGASIASYIQRVNGTAAMTSAGIGAEFYFVQNYSIQIEGGYRAYRVKQFNFLSTTDINGTPKQEGAIAEDGYGKKRTFRIRGPFVEMALCLNF